MYVIKPEMSDREAEREKLETKRQTRVGKYPCLVLGCTDAIVSLV